MELTLSRISQSMSLPLAGNMAVADEPLNRPLVDSRSLHDAAGTLFFAIPTASNDGHRYVKELYDNGVRHFVVEEIDGSQLAAMPLGLFLITGRGGVVEALQHTASMIREMVHCPVVAVTGSRGKTVAKEMLARAAGVRTVTSPRSWNSQLGVPLSMWRIKDDTQLAIIEAGVSRSGEMERLAHIVRPDVGLFTSLTHEHDRGFDDMEHKCRQKCLLMATCSTIIYLDDPMVAKVLGQMYPHKTLVAVDDYPAAIAKTLQACGIDTNTPVNDHHVSTRIDVTAGYNSCIFASDRYSNDLAGVETALDFMRRRMPPNRTLTCVIGDLELRGDDEDRAYDTLQRLLEQAGVDTVISAGSVMSRHLAAMETVPQREYTDGAQQFTSRFHASHFHDTAVLIKSSSATQLAAIKSWLEDVRHDTNLEVNLDALVANFNNYRSLIKKETGVIAMVKADAYGTGAVEVSRTLQAQGADYLAVAVVEEGVQLRRAGISMPVMVLNPIASNYNALIEYNLEPTVFSTDELEKLNLYLNNWHNGRDRLKIHVKLDTGMHRFGFQEEQLDGLSTLLTNSPRVEVATIFSHLATADCPTQDDYTVMQLENFERMSSHLISRLGYTPRRHILNTAGILTHPEYQYDYVRLGIGLYGISPIDGNRAVKLQTVGTLSTRISALQHRHEGDTVGYSRRGKITGEAIIATLPVGYADGLPRRLGNGNISFLVNGVMCPTVGNICMDICMIDVTAAHASIGDRVEIFGNRVPVTTVAQALDTIPYEVFTSVAPRVKRLYYRE